MSADKSKAVQIAEKLSHDLPTILRIDAEAAGDELRRLDAVNRELLEALKIMTAHYCNLVHSGDAGNWEPDAEQEVMTAKVAIAKATDD